MAFNSVGPEHDYYASGKYFIIYFKALLFCKGKKIPRISVPQKIAVVISGELIESGNHAADAVGEHAIRIRPVILIPRYAGIPSFRLR